MRIWRFANQAAISLAQQPPDERQVAGAANLVYRRNRGQVIALHIRDGFQGAVDLLNRAFYQRTAAVIELGGGDDDLSRAIQLAIQIDYDLASIGMQALLLLAAFFQKPG